MVLPPSSMKRSDNDSTITDLKHKFGLGNLVSVSLKLHGRIPVSNSRPLPVLIAEADPAKLPSLARTEMNPTAIRR